MSTIKVLVVDDYQVVREGLRRVLELEKGIQVVGEARDGEEAITKAISLSPDVIVMDLKMPGMDGITATREIKRKMPKVNIPALTFYLEDFIEEAIEAGVSGYLLKDSDCAQITQAIHQVYEGLCPIAPSLTRELVTASAEFSQNNRSSPLTKRQKEVLKLIAAGMNTKEIGSHLFINNSAAKREMRSIFDRLGVIARSHVVFQAIKQQFI